MEGVSEEWRGPSVGAGVRALSLPLAPGDAVHDGLRHDEERLVHEGEAEEAQRAEHEHELDEPEVLYGVGHVHDDHRDDGTQSGEEVELAPERLEVPAPAQHVDLRGRLRHVKDGERDVEDVPHGVQALGLDVGLLEEQVLDDEDGAVQADHAVDERLEVLRAGGRGYARSMRQIVSQSARCVTNAAARRTLVSSTRKAALRTNRDVTWGCRRENEGQKNLSSESASCSEWNTS